MRFAGLISISCFLGFIFLSLGHGVDGERGGSLALGRPCKAALEVAHHEIVPPPYIVAWCYIASRIKVVAL